MDGVFQINNWKIKNFIMVILLIQIGFLGLTFLDYAGMNIPIIKEFIAVIYILFVPGMLLLRIMGLNEIKSGIENVLFVAGLSVMMAMFMGLFMNMVYPVFGIFQPLSKECLIYTFLVFTTILCILCILKDKNHHKTDNIKKKPSLNIFNMLFFIPFTNIRMYFRNFNYNDNLDYISKKYLLNPSALFLILLPFISVFGTYLMNFYNNNIILISLIIINVIYSLFNFIIYSLYHTYIYLYTHIYIHIYHQLIYIPHNGTDVHLGHGILVAHRITLMDN